MAVREQRPEVQAEDPPNGPGPEMDHSQSSSWGAVWRTEGKDRIEWMPETGLGQKWVGEDVG